MCGGVVYQNVVNELIIGGIIKIIAGHDVIRNKFDAKIDKLSRIEWLETWVNKQDEIIKKVQDIIESESRINDKEIFLSGNLQEETESINST